MNQILDLKNYLTLAEAAAKLGICTKTLEVAIRNGELNSFRLKKRLVNPVDLEIWAIKRAAKPHGNFGRRKNNSEKLVAKN